MHDQPDDSFRSVPQGLSTGLRFVFLVIGVLAGRGWAAEEPPPWEAVFGAPGEPPAWEAVCCSDFDAHRALPQLDDVKRWFAPVPGQRFEIRPTRTEAGPCPAFDGLGRLRMPWREGVAWRLSLQQFKGLRLHFFRGTAGVTLAYYEDEQDTWAAYATTRKAGQPLPETFVLAATDLGRARRTEIRRGGTFEVRWQSDELILSRGDLGLLRVACPQLPDEVLLEGKVAVHGLAAVRSQPPAAGWGTIFGLSDPPRADGLPVSDMPSPARPVVATPVDTSRPAELEWIDKLGPGAQCVRAAEGTVELLANKAERSGAVLTRLPVGGVYQVLLEVDQATPGAGVFLGRAEGAASEVLRFVRDRRSGRTCLAMRDDESAELDFPPVRDRLVAFAAPRQWIRLIFGCGAVRCWVSSDGVHWALPEASWGGRPPGVAFVGLHYVKGQDGCRIKLRRLTIRELPHLNALAAPDVRARAMPLNDAANLGIWLTRVTEAQPADVDLSEWRRASALRTLGAGCSRELANALLGLLLDDAARRGVPLEQQRDLLAESALLLDTRDDWQGLNTWVERCHQLAGRAFEDRDERPFTWIRPCLLAAPLVTQHSPRFVPDATIRLELIQLAAEQRWSELRVFCQRVRFFRHFDQVVLFPWAEAVAFRHTSRRETNAPITRLHDDWRQPLIEEISRETYNVLAELRVALDSSSLDDVARLVMSLEPGSLYGLAPSLDDRNLLVSLPAAIRMLLETRPELKERMNSRYGRTALLRVQQAERDGNAAAIQLATAQYVGSDAAAEAHRWLGDRALASGHFVSALTQYRKAAGSAGPTTRQELLPRARLAAALLGRAAGPPGTAEVRFGEVKLAAADFEALLAELAKRPSADPAALQRFDPVTPPIPKPTGFSIPRRSAVDTAVGRESTAEVVPNVRRFNVDWVGRQLATVLEGNTLYVSNRFQVAAYDLPSAQRRWLGQLPADTVQRSQDWALIPARPLVTPTRIFIRLLYQQSPVLVALDKANGQAIWTVEGSTSRHLISDPVLVQGELLALVLLQPEPDDNHLQLVAYDAESGRLLRQHELLRLNDVWFKRRGCEVVPTDDGLIVTLGGATLRCDTAGHVHWVRKHTLLPPAEEPQWVTQHFDRPLLVGEALYVTAPGLRTLERLAPGTGHLAWRAVLPGVVRNVGLGGPRLVVQTDEGFLALDPDTGKEAWKHTTGDTLQLAMCGEAGVVYARRMPLEDGKPGFCPQLVWLNPDTGEPTAVTRLTGLEDPDPRLGPAVVLPDRLWVFFGRGPEQPTRELLELVPQGDAQKADPDPKLVDIWMRHVPARLIFAVARKLGPWRLLAGEATGPQVVEPERWGRRDVPGTRCRPNQPVLLARKMNIPTSGLTKLRMAVGNEPAQEWQLQVRVGGQAVFSKDLTAAADSQPWKTIEVDLSSHAGQTAWLTVEAHFLRGGDQVNLYWETLELVTR
jgi:outer membrane protein assembly factor BamB